MRKPCVLLMVAAALLLALAGSAAAELCPKCRGKMYITSIGKCQECRGHTSSGAFKLCPACSRRLGQCEHCRGPLRAKAPANAIVLDEKANGKTVAATVGKLIIVRLRGNPTTGYSWTAKKLKGDALKQVGKVKYVQRKAPRGMVGVGGAFTAAFQAVKVGRGTIHLVYARPWERNTPPIRQFKAIIEVKRPTPKPLR